MNNAGITNSTTYLQYIAKYVQSVKGVKITCLITCLIVQTLKATIENFKPKLSDGIGVTRGRNGVKLFLVADMVTNVTIIV